MTREYILVGDGEPLYISETGTRQEILATVYLNETVAVAAAGGRVMSKLANYGGLAGKGGIAGKSGGLAG